MTTPSEKPRVKAQQALAAALTPGLPGLGIPISAALRDLSSSIPPLTSTSHLPAHSLDHKTTCQVKPMKKGHQHQPNSNASLPSSPKFLAFWVLGLSCPLFSTGSASARFPPALSWLPTLSSSPRRGPACPEKHRCPPLPGCPQQTLANQPYKHSHALTTQDYRPIPGPFPM